MIVGRYVDKDTGKKHIVADITYKWNGKSNKNKYYVCFNPETSPCNCGVYETLEEAEKVIKRLRPCAAKLNSICIKCTTECFGTFEQVWTGCIYRRT